MKLKLKANEDVTIFDKLEYVVNNNKERFVVSGRTIGIETDDNESYNLSTILLRLLNLNDNDFQNMDKHIGLLRCVLSEKPYSFENAVIFKTKLFLNNINSSEIDNRADTFKISCELGQFKQVTPYEHYDLKIFKNKKYDLENLTRISKLYKDKKIKKYNAYNIDDFEDFIVASLSEVFNKGKTIVKCKNCGKYFIPKNSKALYCYNPSPQNKEKSCKQFAPQDMNSKDMSYKLYTKIRKSLHGKMQYYKDDNFLREEHRNNFELYMSESENIQNDIKNKENYEWLKEQANKYNIKIKDDYGQ